MKIKTNESKGGNTLLNVLFLLPLPIFIVKIFLNKGLDKSTRKELEKVKLYKGTLLIVNSPNEANIYIKAI